MADGIQTDLDNGTDGLGALKTLIDALNDLGTSDLDTALSSIGLDHLLSVAVIGSDVTDNSIFAKLVSKSATADWDDFVNTSDALQAIADDLANGTDGLGALKTLIDAIQTDLDNGTDGLGALKTLIDALNDISTAEVLTQVNSGFTTQMADSVPADGTIPTREQAAYMLIQFLTDFVISGTTRTTRKVNGSTGLMTHTLDDATNPTALTRAT